MKLKVLARKIATITTKGEKRPLYRVSLASVNGGAPDVFLEELISDIDGVSAWMPSQKFEDCLYCLMANGEMEPDIEPKT